jgi:general secretion pathway protein H
MVATGLNASPPKMFETQNALKSQRAVVQGFTLIEMLIVLAIAGIVMGTLVPSFGPAIARAQLYSASRDVASALRYTRGHAMIRGEDALFELNTIHHTYRVSGRPKLYRLPPGIELGLFTTSTETLDEGTGRIRFFPDGSATGGRVTLIAAKQTRVVDINWLTGEITIGEEDSGEH